MLVHEQVLVYSLRSRNRDFRAGGDRIARIRVIERRSVTPKTQVQAQTWRTWSRLEAHSWPRSSRLGLPSSLSSGQKGSPDRGR